MTEYWGKQMEYMEDGMAKLERYLAKHPDSPSLQSFVNEKRENFKVFRQLTSRFCTLGTECETVKKYLRRIKNNSKSSHFGDLTFLRMLDQEEFFFSLNPDLMEKMRKEKISYQDNKYEQMSFDDILPKEDTSSDEEDLH